MSWDDLYQNSLCSEGLWLHKYHIVETLPNCVVEVCERCGDKQIFANDGSNRHYLSYHIRSAIQFDDLRFNKEYKRK